MERNTRWFTLAPSFGLRALCVSNRTSRAIRFTFLGELTSVIAAVWVTRRIATDYPLQVAGYLVLRQILNWFLNIGLWGLNVSLPRALAAEPRPGAWHILVKAALLLTAPGLLIIALVAVFAPRPVALLLLHNADAERLLVAAVFLFATNGGFALGAKVLQGIDRFGLLALGRFLAFALGPVAVVASLSSRVSLPTVLGAWGAATLAIDVLLAGPIWLALRPAAHPPTTTDSVLVASRRLLGYGGLRMMGGIAYLAVFATAPSLALWAGASADAAAALSTAALFGALFSPVYVALYQVALTRLSQPMPPAEARRLAEDFYAGAACVAAAFIGLLAASGDRLVALWLGDQFRAYGALVRVAVIAVGLQCLCGTLEGVIDAADPAHQRPRAQFMAVLLFFIGAGLSVAFAAGWPGIVMAQLVAAVVLAVLYTRLIARRYGLPSRRELYNGALTVGGAAFAAGLPLRWTGHGLSSTVLLVSGQASAALIAFWLARSAGVRWPALILGERGRAPTPPVHSPERSS